MCEEVGYTEVEAWAMIKVYLLDWKKWTTQKIPGTVQLLQLPIRILSCHNLIMRACEHVLRKQLEPLLKEYGLDKPEPKAQ